MKKIIFFMMIAIVVISCNKEEFVDIDTPKTKRIVIKASIDEDTKVMVEEVPKEGGKGRGIKCIGFNTNDVLNIYFSTKRYTKISGKYNTEEQSFMIEIPENITDEDLEKAICILNNTDNITDCGDYVETSLKSNYTWLKDNSIKLLFTGKLTKSGDDWICNLKADYALLRIHNNTNFNTSIYIRFRGNDTYGYFDQIVMRWNKTDISAKPIIYGNYKPIGKSFSLIRFTSNETLYVFLPTKFMSDSTAKNIEEPTEIQLWQTSSSTKPGKCLNPIRDCKRNKIIPGKIYDFNIN